MKQSHRCLGLTAARPLIFNMLGSMVVDPLPARSRDSAKSRANVIAMLYHADRFEGTVPQLSFGTVDYARGFGAICVRKVAT